MSKKSPRIPKDTKPDEHDRTQLDIREYGRFRKEEDYKPTDPPDYESKIHGSTRRI